MDHYLKQALELLRDNVVALAISSFLAYFLFVKSKAIRELSVQHAGISLIANAAGVFPDEVTVLYHGVVVPQLTLTRIVIWNEGNQTIHGNEIATRDPLRIELGGNDSFLEARVLYVSRPVNDFKLVEDEGVKNRRRIVFDFLDPNDGAIVELLHTSGSYRIPVFGTIQGIPKGLTDHGSYLALLNPPEGRQPWWKRIANAVFSGTTMVLFFLGAGVYSLVKAFLFPLTPEEMAKQAHAFNKVSIAFGFVSLSIALLSYWVDKRHFPKSFLEEIPSDDPKT